eukprot:m.146565 g.146565  ORF g.146565 m.146565 type:complete len:565 (+) comp23116_c0_seq1:43-1737(+)
MILAAVLSALCVTVDGSAIKLSAESGAAPLVHLDGLGGFRGSRNNGADMFLGIKYAVPPIGPLRFKPSRVADSSVYRQGEQRDATDWCDECMQGSLAEPADTAMSEDCLCLNVWAPSGASSSTTSRPVYVFIHGGGFISGASSVRWMVSDKLALAADAVVVTINYRLGPLGFLVTDEADALGNGGMHGIGDQIVALEFVRRHIAKFGGDPTRVTIGGQSSGSSAVCTLSVSPLAKGLFHQAVAESGPCIGLWGPLNETYGRAARQRVYTSLDVSSIDELRALPAANITWADPDMNYILFNGYFLDGAVSPGNPINRYLDGAINPDRIIFGANSMDGVIPYGYECAGCAPPATPAEYPTDLRQHWGETRGANVERQYPLSRFAGSGASAFVRADADGTVVCASYAQAVAATRANKTAFAYLYDYTKGEVRGCDVSADIKDDMHSSAAPQNCSDPAKCGEVGWASHASEIPFFFGTTAGASFLGGLEHQVCPFTEKEKPLVKEMQGYLRAYIHGEPPDEAWPSVGVAAEGPVVNHIDVTGSSAASLGLRAADCRFWAKELGLPWTP